MRRLIVLLAWLAGCAGAWPALGAPPTEYQLKAVFLLNFARYTTFPDEAFGESESMDICVLGRDPFGDYLRSLESRQAQGRPVRVRYPDTPHAAVDCKVVFIASSEQRRLNVDLIELRGRAVLTVSDIEGFVEAGGAVGLVTEDDRIRFDVNRAAVDAHGLRMSAQVLKLARRVLGEVP